MKVLIIDDEQHSHLALKTQLKQKYFFVEILDKAHNIAEECLLKILFKILFFPLLLCIFSCTSESSPFTPIQLFENNLPPVSENPNLDKLKEQTQQIEVLLQKNKPLEALTLSSKVDSLSIYLFKSNPETRLKIIQKRIDLIYDYGLKEALLDDIEKLLEEGTSLLKKHPSLLSAGKKIFYWKGVLAYGNRNYKEGVNDLITAIELEQKHSNKIDTGFIIMCYSKIGILWKGAHEMEKAKKSFQEAIYLSQGLNDTNTGYQILMEDLSILYANLNDSIKTFQCIEILEALPTEKKMVSTDRLRGLWYFKQKKFRQSIAAYKKLEKKLDNQTIIFQRDKLYDESIWLLYKMHLQEKKFDIAFHYLLKKIFFEKPELQNSAINWRAIKNNLDIFKVSSRKFIQLGLLAEILHNQALAESNKEVSDSLKMASIQIMEQTDSLMFDYAFMENEEVANNLIEEVGLKYYPFIINNCYEQYQETKNPLYISKANKFIERLKSFSLSKDVKKQQLSRENLLPILKKLSVLEKEQRNINQVLAQGGNQQKRVQLGFLNNQRKRLIDQLKETDFPSFQLIMQQSFNPQNAISSYFENNKQPISFIQYYVKEEHLFIIYNDNKNTLFFKKPISKLIHGKILAYKKLLSKIDFKKETKEKLDNISIELSDFLIGGEISHLLKQDQKLVIIPHGILQNLPFESFQKEKKYWLVNKDVQYGFSLKTFVETRNKKSYKDANAKVLAFSYSPKTQKNSILRTLTNNASLGPLKGGAKEVAFIEKVFKNNENQFYYGVDSQKKVFKKQAKKHFDIIHLALHGSSNIAKKNRNFLLFSSPNGSEQNTKLSEIEIENLDLSTSLVVLSACSTNQGKLIESEGIYNLARAFKKAGASTILTTLWEIDDELTSRIMQKFYVKLKEGLSPSKALRIAKKEYLNHSEELLRHPFFWSGIVVYE